MIFFQRVYDYVFIIQLLTVCLSLVIIFYPIKKNVKSILIAILHFVILFLMGTLLNYGLFALAEIVTPLRGINFPISWLLLILGYLFFVKIPFINSVLMGGTLFVTVDCAICLGRQLMPYVPHLFADGINIFVCVFIILYSIVLNRLSLKVYTDLPLKSAIMLLVITICLSSLLISKQSYDLNKNIQLGDSFYIFSLISFYIMSICSYLMLYFYAKVKKTNVQLQVENKMLEADKERIEMYENSREDFHLLRHDFYNQMNVMEIMLENKEYDELQKYFNSMRTNLNLDNRYDFIDCGNPTINSVINMEIMKGRKHDIDIVPNINVPSELPFEESDICRILVNLIDNSIEALLRNEIESKKINLQIMTHGEYLYIGVQNPIGEHAKPEKVLALNTEKEDQSNHGFGHRIVKKIVDKYNGHVNYSIEEGTFFAEVMLDIEYDTKR